ncbi:hypothetical protein [Nocardia spumae]|uniref:hypothetical protein n=1 Tax=Nocardia spumae TaxID=2887190 RepID=UPI001D156764|nr:hypothetical protein [Nocardia spumae]
MSPLTLAMTGAPESSRAVRTLIPQPTPQYEHAVLTVLGELSAALDTSPMIASARCDGFTQRYRQMTKVLTRADGVW